MAVYTDVTAEDLTAFLAGYDLGELLSYKGIAEGVENSNFLVHTSRGYFILTLYEKRVAAEYATSTFPTQGLESWITGRVGVFLYRNLVLAADQEGLYMRTVRGTSVFHGPLFVPWEDISIGEGRNLWFPMVRFTFSRAVRGSIMLGPDLARKLLDKKGVTAAHLSLSDEKGVAFATVILECEK